MTGREKQAEREKNWQGALQWAGAGAELTLLAMLPGGTPVYAPKNVQSKADEMLVDALVLDPEIMDMQLDGKWRDFVYTHPDEWRLSSEPGYIESLMYA